VSRSRASEPGAWGGNVDAPASAASEADRAPASGAAAAGTGTAAATGSGLHAAPPADPAMDDPESGGPRAGL